MVMATDKGPRSRGPEECDHGCRVTGRACCQWAGKGPHLPEQRGLSAGDTDRELPADAQMTGRSCPGISSILIQFCRKPEDSED